MVLWTEGLLDGLLICCEYTPGKHLALRIGSIPAILATFAHYELDTFTLCFDSTGACSLALL